MKVVAAGLFTLLAAECSLFGSPVFSVQSGGISITSQNLTTAGTQAAPWTVNETMTATGTLALTDTDGVPLGTLSPFDSGSWFTKTVLNNSGVTWTSFELELQEIIGTPSPDGDGLSFAQGAGLVFSSDRFSTYTRIDTTRDYLNFSGGSVLNGQSVIFRIAITDNTPQSPVYLLQTPNKADVMTPEPASTLLLVSGLVAGLMFRKKNSRR